MDAMERRCQIIEILCDAKMCVKMRDLASRFNVSVRTIRTDVDFLSVTYPIETTRGRYNGGISFIEGYSPRKARLMSAFQPFLVLLFWFGSEQIHSSLFEAAICEGASARQCFFRIYIPLLSPYILAGSLLSVVESWNMLEQPMTFLQPDSQMVLSTYFLQQTGDAPAATATQALLSALPLLLVFAWAAARLRHPPGKAPLYHNHP